VELAVGTKVRMGEVEKSSLQWMLGLKMAPAMENIGIELRNIGTDLIY